MESGRRNFIMGYDPLGWGGNIHGNRKENLIMGHDPLGWRGGIHGIKKRKLYHGTREGVALVVRRGERG